MVAVTFPSLEVVQFLDAGSEAGRAATLLCGVQSVLSNVRWKSAAERVAECGIPSLVIVNAKADGLLTPKVKPPASATSAEALALCVCRQVYFSSGLEMKVTLSRRAGTSARGNPELVPEGLSCLYGSLIKDECELMFQGMESPCLCLKS